MGKIVYTSLFQIRGILQWPWTIVAGVCDILLNWMHFPIFQDIIMNASSNENSCKYQQFKPFKNILALEMRDVHLVYQFL